MVEASPALRQAQHKLLCGDNLLNETKIGYTSTSKYSPDLQIIWCEDVRFVPRGMCPFIFFLFFSFLFFFFSFSFLFLPPLLLPLPLPLL